MNLPNKLSLMRIILIPVLMFFYLATFIPCGIGKIVALIVFAVAAITDFFDGKIARSRNMVTNLGKFLDATADKCLVNTAFILFLSDSTFAFPWGVIVVVLVVARDLMIGALRQIAATKGTVMAADMWGKAKTMVTMITLVLFFIVAYFNCCGFEVASWLYLTIKVVAYVGLGASAVLTVLSAVNYIWKNRSCLREN